MFLISSSFVQISFGTYNHDPIAEWGTFGVVEPGHFSYPQFIAVSDDDGSIYVSDFGNKRIQKFSSNGEYITDWGQSGKQVGNFYNPSGIAVGIDSVFVVDRDLNRIQKFSLDGEFISTWGAKGTSGGQFLYPNGIAINNGILYVVDTGNQRIQMFSTDGEFISSFGSSGLGEGKFLNVAGIDVDVDGNVYVTDKGNNKIEKFNADGELIKSFPFYFPSYVFSPEAIAVDNSGDM
ncbi:MAG: 6-bladed beta-propeller, partial [Nitrosopumilus sp.]|nr:6-bladed beta-propeller [Nitrosopumilus sp.]